jgi:hypothetical protein
MNPDTLSILRDRLAQAQRETGEARLRVLIASVEAYHLKRQIAKLEEGNVTVKSTPLPTP